MTDVEDVRARILDKARELLLTRGYSQMTMEALGGELRMSKKTLYRVFPSKEALGEAVIAAYFADVGEELAGLRQREDLDFDARLRLYVKTIAGHYHRAARALEELQRDAPSLWKTLLEARRRAVQDNFGALVTLGVRAGAFRSDVEPRLLLRMMLTLVDQLLRPDVQAELDLSTERIFTHMMDVLLDGLRTGRPTG